MSKITIASNDQVVHPIDVACWTEFADAVLAREGVAPPAELNLNFVDLAAMTELNLNHMGYDEPTDVLSFPLDDEESVVFEDQARLLGDIVICPAVVYAQAEANQPDAPDPFEAELALMVVHGVLHILGMDHAEAKEAAEMKAAEQRHLAAWVPE